MHYLSSLGTQVNSLCTRSDRLGTGELRVVEIELRDTSGRQLDAVRSGQDVDIYLYYKTSNGFQSSGIIASIMVKTQLDIPVFQQHNRLTRNHWDTIPPEGVFVCRLQRLPLPPAVYRIAFSVLRHGEYLDALSDAAEITVTEGDFFGSGEVPPISHGCCLVDAEWRIETDK